MNSSSGFGGLWRIFAPLVFWWLINFATQLVVTTFVLVTMWAPEYLPQVIDEAYSFEMIQRQIVERFLESEYMLIATSYYVFLGPIFASIYTVLAFRNDNKVEAILANFTLKKSEVGQYVLLVGLAISVSLGLNLALIMAMIAFPNLGYNQVAANLILTLPIWLKIIGIGFIIPTAEEFLFRGLIFKRYFERSGNLVNSMIFSAVVFGFFHSYLTQFIYAFCTGLLLAYIYNRFDTIKAPIIFRIIINLFSIALFTTGGLEWILYEPLRLPILVVTSAFVGSLLFVLIRDRISNIL